MLVCTILAAVSDMCLHLNCADMSPAVHSGCAISGLVWLILFTVQATIELMHGGKVGRLTFIISPVFLITPTGVDCYCRHHVLDPRSPHWHHLVRVSEVQICCT